MAGTVSRTSRELPVHIPRRIILAIGIFLVARPAVGGAEVEVAGRWRGVVTMKGFAYHHLVKVKKTGRGFAAKALVWAGLTESQALAAARGRKPAVSDKAFAFALLQAYDVAFGDDVLAFSGGKVKHLFRVLGNYETFTFSGKVEPPGILTAAARDAAGETGTVQLWKDGALDRPLPLGLKRGVVHKLACRHTERYHYTCYLPESYDHSTPTPVLVNFSPGGNGKPLSTKMAGELGWIMVGLTESKNGPIQPSAENRDAVLLDIRRRFNVHPRRLYFSGCSGGARMAAWSARSYPQWCAGAICIAAGFLQSRPPPHQAVFFIAGESDFNKDEVTKLHAAEKRKGRRTRLVIHPGGHNWGRAQDHEAAIRWLEGLAGKAEKEKR
jgi:predicted esterase